MRFVFVVFRLAYERAKAAPAVRGRNRVIGGLFTGWGNQDHAIILPLTDLYGVFTPKKGKAVSFTTATRLSAKPLILL